MTRASKFHLFSTSLEADKNRITNKSFFSNNKALGLCNKGVKSDLKLKLIGNWLLHRRGIEYLPDKKNGLKCLGGELSQHLEICEANPSRQSILLKPIQKHPWYYPSSTHHLDGK